MIRRLSWVVIALFVASVLSGCADDDLPDNSRLLDAFEQGRTGVWVSGHGTVSQIQPDTSIGLPQQRFMVRIDDSLRVLVFHSLVESQRVPVERGDTVSFQGRYEFNASGGVILRTHLDPGQPGDGGWIRHEGVVYD